MLAYLLVTHSPNASVSYSAHRMLSRGFNGAIVRQIVTCHNHVWQKLVLLVTDQPRPRHIVYVVVSAALGSLPRSFPRHVISRRSQAEANRVIVRHFFNWLSRMAERYCQGKPVPSSSPARHCREGCDGATARGWSWDGAHARIPTNPSDSRGRIARRRCSRASNPEWEIGDSGLQTGLGPSFSAAARAAEGSFGVGLRR
jgi:hypothetical protein